MLRGMGRPSAEELLEREEKEVDGLERGTRTATTTATLAIPGRPRVSEDAPGAVDAASEVGGVGAVGEREGGERLADAGTRGRIGKRFEASTEESTT